MRKVRQNCRAVSSLIIGDLVVTKALLCGTGGERMNQDTRMAEARENLKEIERTIAPYIRRRRVHWGPTTAPWQTTDSLLLEMHEAYEVVQKPDDESESGPSEA